MMLMDKDDVLRFRVSATEKEAIERAAKRDGKTSSAWLRMIALAAAGYRPENEQKPGESLRDYVIRRLDGAAPSPRAKKGKR
jgi:hypothetical protein